MLLVIMHSDKRYLEEVCSAIKKEGISRVFIYEKKGLVKSLSGIKDNLFFGMSQPDLTDEFDYALIAAVPGEEKVKQLKERVKMDLRFYPTNEKTLILKLPFGSIEELFKKSEEEK